jgi:predicted metal-dependent HD superfamily phosphohydrolase
METETDSAVVERRWRELCSNLSLPPDRASEVWQIIAQSYSEPTRFYHTLRHLFELLTLSALWRSELSDPSVVDLAIFFHDVVYDAHSGSNEEDSAQLFRTLLPHLDTPILERVVHYILETKKHAVSASGDRDLQLFVDFDMAVLGATSTRYCCIPIYTYSVYTY